MRRAPVALARFTLRSHVERVDAAAALVIVRHGEAMSRLGK